MAFHRHASFQDWSLKPLDHLSPTRQISHPIFGGINHVFQTLLVGGKLNKVINIFIYIDFDGYLLFLFPHRDFFIPRKIRSENNYDRGVIADNHPECRNSNQLELNEYLMRLTSR